MKQCSPIRFVVEAVMFVENLSQKLIETRLQPVISEFEEIVIPHKVDLLPNNTYSADYAWMYSFEKKLKYRIEGLLKNKFSYTQEKLLFGSGGAVSEGLSNAFVHGHKKDTRLTISVWVCVSKKGLGFSITDTGEGFDYHTIFTQYKSGKTFFSIAGNGFTQLFKSEEISACYLHSGTKLCLLYTL